MLRRSCSILLPLVLAAGCAQVFGFDTLADRDDAAPDASIDGPTDPVFTVYVSPRGDDLADGTREHPLRSIRVGTERAMEARRDQGRPRVLVCAGTYAEGPIDARGGIDIQGDYDCTSWTRRAVDQNSLGPATTSGTEVSDAIGSDVFLSLTGDASGVPRLEGFDLTVTQSPLAVSLVTGSMADTSIVNVSRPSSALGMTTVGIVATGNALIERCSVRVQRDEGVGTGAGIVVASGVHTVRRNRVYMVGLAGRLSGLTATERAETDLFENSFELVGGSESVENRISSIGIRAQSATMRSTRNSVLLVAPANTQAQATVVGILVEAPSRVSSDGDRIIGPSGAAPSSANRSVQFSGLYVEGTLERLVNASIVFDPVATTAVARAAGVSFAAPSSALVAHNTIYLGGVPAEPAAAYARGIVFDNGVTAPTSVRFDANLVILGEPRMGLVRATCTPSQFASMARNVYGGSDAPAEGINRCADSLDDLWEGADSSNHQLSCGSSCAQLLALGRDRVATEGLKLTPEACADPAMMVASTTDVTTDGAGSPRDPARTLVGAFANCP